MSFQVVRFEAQENTESKGRGQEIVQNPHVVRWASMMAQVPFILPPTANIPREWVAKEDGFTKQIVCPSWSRKGGEVPSYSG